MKYRSEKLWGSGQRDAISVVAFEIFELGNADILLTLRDTLLSRSDMLPQIDRVISNLDNGELDDYDEPVALAFCISLLAAVRRVTGTQIRYVLWLCDSVKDVLAYDLSKTLTADDIDAYPESDIVLADLGSGGRLYGYEAMPKPIANDRG